MAETSGTTLNIIYNTAAPTYSALATGNNNLISSSMDARWLTDASVQILTDGGAIVNYTVQVTNIPTSLAYYGQKVLGLGARDDAYGSQMWSTVSTGIIAKNVGVTQGALVTMNLRAVAFVRCLFNWDAGNTAGSTAQVFAIGRGASL